MRSERPSSSESTSDAMKVPVCRYVRHGVGGAGNYHKIDNPLPPAPPALTLTPPDPQSIFSSGIGGIGNMRRFYQRATISPEERVKRIELQQSLKPYSYHFGIGGAGNRSKDHGHRRNVSTSPRATFKSIALPFELAAKIIKKVSGTNGPKAAAI